MDKQRNTAEPAVFLVPQESIYSATFAEYIEHGVLRRTAQAQ